MNVSKRLTPREERLLIDGWLPFVSDVHEQQVVSCADPPLPWHRSSTRTSCKIAPIKRPELDNPRAGEPVEEPERRHQARVNRQEHLGAASTMHDDASDWQLELRT